MKLPATTKDPMVEWERAHLSVFHEPSSSQIMIEFADGEEWVPGS